MKKFDSYKHCIITTSAEEFSSYFTNDWTFKDIESWMFDTYCIERESIESIRISNVTIYKNSKNA